MHSFRTHLAKVAAGEALSRDAARAAFDDLLSGEVTPVQAGAFLTALKVRGETTDEIAGAVSAMRGRMLRVEAPEGAIDIVGTGGDHSGSYNVSTLAAIVAAACGVPVAKHGNRAATSRSGAADVLASLGVKLGLDPDGLGRCLAQAGLCFMFAQTHHGAMRHVAPVRAELPVRTIFNLLGPLSNPAGVERQLLGVSAAEWAEPLARVLADLGTRRVWAVHGSDGLDEITVTGPTEVVEIADRHLTRFCIDPREVGLPLWTLDDLRGGDPDHNARALRAVLDGEAGAYRDIAVLNAGAGLVVAGVAGTLAEGVARADAAIGSGAARATLARLVAVSNA
ncbi:MULTISPECIES: anthranilate phosphoribosyltransferase [Methylobacterium]|uniref:Anthranilate phosphoribosyltransferase n=1 Tax=Methylobacterium jeotgali TaxID=381630 RepID=A0ABQ4SUM1_9HYPH|nr:MULTISPECIES: anthranilate phosphoribosyltransferase [Methylobacterium]PIU04296.1 MAG: anthranilate phosphoribosyltransferase [Methylobacterium sp. CG09_land_8_20_14_0_10_71_15]PIU11560.1 MAG: anthranilate phosphoribosyltransferase [Methylobacterium sp. CG08_land_8_20_14_0_20_71_15]GBU16636.1 anthranilate phosphoribosyltransferase [Methylobacterium sp.]GJE05568.1 Anthranilate phosphoribosyltransferase [Methylobacterium jeotgali]